MTRIRPARPDDIDWLLDQLRAFDRFYGTKRSLFPIPERAERFLTLMIGAHPFFVALSPTYERIGFIAGMLGPHPYTPQIRVLTETFWWVAPEHRGGRAGLLLLDAFIEDGRQRADWIVMTIEHKSPISDRVLAKRGFQPQERSYLLEIENSVPDQVRAERAHALETGAYL